MAGGRWRRQREGERGGRSRVPLVVVSLLAALLLGACTGDLNTPGEALRILGSRMPPAYVGQPYEQAIQAVGGLRPYEISVADGQLPPGITLQGGTLRGTPSKTGQSTFTIQVSDANLSKTVQKYTLTVAEVPPPRLLLHVPSTQVDRQLTLHAEVVDARKLEGLRSQIRWDPTKFKLVPDSVHVSRQGLALLRQTGSGELQVAVIPLGTTLSGTAALFTFDLEPVAGASFLKVEAATETMWAGGRHYAKTSEGRSPPPTPPSNGGTNAPPAGGTSP